VNDEQAIILANDIDHLEITATTPFALHKPLVVRLLLGKWPPRVADPSIEFYQ
jgi:hypothetical protein